MRTRRAGLHHRRPSLAACALGLIALVGAGLACGGPGATEANVRILDMPQFVCPSVTPMPTNTQPPTAVQPSLTAGPMVCSLVCITPSPSGPSSCMNLCGATPAAMPGPTSTPGATYTPYPTPTPFVGSGDFFLGGDVFSGGFESAVRIRFRLDNVQVLPIDEQRQVVVWEIQLGNVGAVTYFALPGAQVFVAEINQGGELVQGQWFASAEAAQAVGIPLAPELLDILPLEPGDSVILQITAFTPPGEVVRFGWAFDPYSGGHDRDLKGGNVAYWRNEYNPDCLGGVGAGAAVPTVAVLPTWTPTATPYIPPWTGDLPDFICALFESLKPITGGWMPIGCL